MNQIVSYISLYMLINKLALTMNPSTPAAFRRIYTHVETIIKLIEESSISLHTIILKLNI